MHPPQRRGANEAREPRLAGSDNKCGTRSIDDYIGRTGPGMRGYGIVEADPVSDGAHGPRTDSSD